MKNLIYILFVFIMPLHAQMKIVYNIQNGIVITSVESFLVSKCTVFTNNDVTVNSYEDEGAMNSAINLLDASLFPDLPNTGTIYENELYSYNEMIVRCLQEHERTIYEPLITPALFAVYRINSDELEWTENEQVLIGWKRVSEGITYECLQSHMTFANWHPTLTLSVLWKIVQTGDPDCEEAKEWDINDHWTTYTLGDRRTNAGKLWEVVNVGFTYYEPSGAYGHYGWIYIKDCE